MGLPLYPIHNTPFIGGPTPALLYVSAAGLQQAVKCHLSAAVPPAVTDDASAGYSVGSWWFDAAAKKAYVCTDAAAGAAVWIVSGEGVPGPAGAAGADGADGAPGLDGADGAPGLPGADGAPGLDGADGADGREVALRNSGTALEWQYVGEAWSELVTLAAITGPAGLDGADGADGAPGLDGADGVDATPYGVLGITIDGAGSAITTGVKGFLRVPYDCTILEATLLADQACDVVIDVWRDTYANAPPTDADTITASAPPTLSSAAKATDTTLTGWTKTITAGDVLAFNVDSAATITRVTLLLRVQKT